MRLRRQERESGLILKDEWRLNLRPLSVPPIPALYPPPISARAYICMRKAPGSSPIWGGEAGGYLSYSLLQKQ